MTGATATAQAQVQPHCGDTDIACSIDTPTAGDVVINGSHSSVRISLPTVSIGGSVTNNGTITFGGMLINQGTISTGIVNNGNISFGRTGLGVNGTASISGGITNSTTGTISFNTLGISVGNNTIGSIATPFSTFSGGITNNGSISAFNGVSVGAGTNTEGALTFGTFTGGITNVGTITAGNNGIIVNNGSTFSGGITNSGIIAANTQNAGGAGITVENLLTFSGNISNSGTISAVPPFPRISTGIGISNVSAFSGSIVNGGTITAGTIAPVNGGIPTGTGILISNVSTFSGNIVNSGTISAGNIGIAITGVPSFIGGITNTGTIAAPNGIQIQSPSTPEFDSGVITGTIELASGDTLTLGPGFLIGGNVVGVGNNILQLGGTGTGSFNVSNINDSTIVSVPPAQFQGFDTFVKTGTSTWTLTGTTTALTPWMINQGVLSVSTDANLGASAGGLTFNGGTLNTTATFASARTTTLDAGGGTFDINPGTTLTMSGVIGGPGDLTKVDAGTLVLTAANAYTGATTVSDGTLQAGGVNAFASTSAFTIASGALLDLNNFSETVGSLAGAGNVTLGSGTLTAGGNNTSTGYSGDISGTGGLVKTGNGTFTLSGANSYTEGTTLAAGSLGVGSNGALGTGGLTMAGGTTLQAAANGVALPNAITLGGADAIDSQGFTLALSGPISGAGSLIKIGIGTLTLSGENNYSGGTSVNSGTLAIGSGTALGTGGLALANGATLQATGSFALTNPIALNGAGIVDNNNNAITLGGNITGSGSLNEIGNGFVVLSGTNSYSGGTNILGGVLIGTTASLQGNILDNAGLVFDQATVGTYAGSLSGNGSLTIHGAGQVTFTGDSSSFSGETRLAQGELEVGTLATPNASLGGTINIFDGGVLSGHGTVGTVNNLAGIVAPGGTIGTLTVAGNFTQSSTGTLLIEVSPSASSQLKVGGAAMLGGNLTLNYDPGTYTPRTYTFLTAPSVTGSFNAVTIEGAPPPLSQGLTIDPSTGQVVLGGGGAFAIAPNNDTVFPEIVTALVQDSQQANSIVLDRLASRLNSSAADNTVLASLATPPSLQLAQVGGSNLGTVQSVATALPQAFAERGGWFRGIGSIGTTNGNNTAPGFNTSSGGFLLGFDQPVTPDTVLGVAAGYTHTNLDEHSTSSGGINTARVMLYGGGVVGSALWGVTAGYAHDSIETERDLTDVGSARASYGANELTFGAQGSLPLWFGDVAVTPQAGVRAVRLFQSGFTETGAGGSSLAGTPDTVTSAQPFIGATASRSFVTDSGIQITPGVQLGYARELASNNRNFGISSADGTTFIVQGIEPSRDILTAGAGLSVRASDNLYLYADYDATLPTGNTFNQTFSAGVRLLFPPYSPTPASGAAPSAAAPVPQLVAPDADQAQLLTKQQELFDQTFRDPANLGVIYNYAATSAQLGDNEATVEALERILLFNPNLPSAHIELGVLYYRMGSYNAAQAYLDKARTLHPSAEEQARIDEYTAKIAAAQQASGFAGMLAIGTQYQSDANVAPASALVSSPIGDVLLNTQFVKHEDSNFFATGSFLYSYDLGTPNGDTIEVTGTGFGNHYLQFNRLDLAFGELTAGARFRFPALTLGPVEAVSVKPYVILNEVGLGEKQYFWTYGTGLQATATLWNDLSAKVVYEFRQKSFTNAPDRPLSTGLDGNDNLVALTLSKPITPNSDLYGEFDYLDQSTSFDFYTNYTYSVGAGYRIRYEDPTKWVNLPWETVFFGSRTWSIYQGPDPCCNTSGTATFSPSARDDRHWRFGIAQSFPLKTNLDFVALVQRDVLSSNLPIYGYTSNSFLLNLKMRF